MDNAPEKKEPAKRNFSLFTIGRHLIFIAIALTITLLVFEFWGQLGSAMGTVLALDDSPPKVKGEVSVTILPAPNSAPAPDPACSGDHPKDSKCP